MSCAPSATGMCMHQQGKQQCTTLQPMLCLRPRGRLYDTHKWDPIPLPAGTQPVRRSSSFQSAPAAAMVREQHATALSSSQESTSNLTHTAYKPTHYSQDTALPGSQEACSNPKHTAPPGGQEACFNTGHSCQPTPETTTWWKASQGHNQQKPTQYGTIRSQLSYYSKS